MEQITWIVEDLDHNVKICLLVHIHIEPVTVNETTTISIDTVSRWLGYKQNQPVAEMCGGGKKIYKKISLNKINDILNKNAKFKMPKHHKIEFKNFIEFQINQ